MAGLSTAWRLSESGWTSEFESITVYQRGWRLGGKGASSRGDEWPDRGTRPARLVRMVRERSPSASGVLRGARPGGPRPGLSCADVERRNRSVWGDRAGRTAQRGVAPVDHGHAFEPTLIRRTGRGRT